MTYAPSQIEPEGFVISREKSLNETDIGIARSTVPVEHTLESTTTSETHVFLTTRNAEIRVVRHSSVTSAPTAYATLNFDYEMTWHDPRHDRVTVLFTLRDSSGNRISEFWMPKMYIACGVHHYNGQSEFDPKYFDSIDSAAFLFRWGDLRPKVNFRRC